MWKKSRIKIDTCIIWNQVNIVLILHYSEPQAKLYRLRDFVLWSRYHSTYTHPKSMAASTKLPRSPTMDAAILNARNQYSLIWCRKILQKRFQKILKKSFLRLHRRFATPETETLPPFHKEKPGSHQNQLCRNTLAGEFVKNTSFHIPRCTFHRFQRRFATHQRLNFTCISQRKAWQPLRASRNTFWHYFME